MTRIFFSVENIIVMTMLRIVMRIIAGSVVVEMILVIESLVLEGDAAVTLVSVKFEIDRETLCTAKRGGQEEYRRMSPDCL